MQELREAIEELRGAMVSADRGTLERLTASALNYGHTSGLIENREEFVRAIAGGDRRDVFEDIQLSEQTIEITGDIAIVRHRFQAMVFVNGKPMTPDIRVLQVWQHQQGAWRLLARQAYKV